MCKESAKLGLAALKTNNNILCITDDSEEEKYSACLIIMQVDILIIFLSNHVLPIPNNINLYNYTINLVFNH